ncbi:PAS domain-containing protein [Falsiroseomonas sp.]|uniref:PAS domain-containing protein n=1 Tax=Falsiroseomonas sp. TaxID=2870721 RepID=UPI0027376808|nr:PAS domain-containing protein [Falsiroseomonas sp.]MDP3417728.1 PAS domain-containing protein [Falsiroseomonas sp.]
MPLRWGLAAAVLTPLLVFAVSASRSWDQAWHGAEVEVTRTADAAAEYARRLLEGQVLRLQRANELLAGLSDAEIRAQQTELHRALAGIAAEREPAEQAAFYIFAYDRDGDALVASNLLPVPAPDPVLREREFNQALRGPQAPWVHVSRIYVGRTTRRAYFSVAARRTGAGNGAPPGTYDGVLVASIYLDHARAALSALGAAEGDRVALVRADGVLLALSGDFGSLRPEAMRVAPDSPALAGMAQGLPRIIEARPSATDGVERVAAFRRVGGDWPVYAAAARARPAVVAAWRQAVAPQAVLALGSALLLLLLARVVLRRQAALVATNAALERRVEDRTRDLRERESMLRLAQQAAGAGSWSWEPETGRLQWSEEMFALLGLHHERDAASSTLDGFMATVHPEDRAMLRAAILSGLAEGAMTVEFRVFRRRADGRRDEVWLFCRARLYPAEGGKPARMVGIDIDINERRRAEARFAVATAAMAGFVYEWEVATGRVERTGGADVLLGHAVGLSAEEWLARIHPEDRDRVDAAILALREDPDQHSFAMEYRVARADGGWAWLWDRGQVTRDPSTGAPAWLVGGAVDVTARRIAEERQFLLLREVDHRAKNALAVVKAALRLTPRDDAASFAAAVDGRIDALARAQTLLSETSWSGTPLREMLDGALEAFVSPARARHGQPGMPQVTLEGPAVVLAAAAIQPLAMAVHELATNATKYGALSCPGGRLRVRWRMLPGQQGEGQDQGAQDRLEVEWIESGGPTLAAPPVRRGFGTRVVDGTVRSQLGGRVEWHWAAEGLNAVLSMPARRVLQAETWPWVEPRAAV